MIRRNSNSIRRTATCTPPSSRGGTAVDARVPGGTFAATLYAYGEIMLRRKKTGTVRCTAGNNHWYYCGLTDGNYGQDQAAKLAENPWLVDFDLRSSTRCAAAISGWAIRDVLRRNGWGAPEEREQKIGDRYNATLAFGHTGFLILEGGISNTARSYFNLQQVRQNYARERPSTSLRQRTRQAGHQRWRGRIKGRTDVRRSRPGGNIRTG